MPDTPMSPARYKKLLPDLKCPFCGKMLHGLRMNGPMGGAIQLSWICDCVDFENINNKQKNL